MALVEVNSPHTDKAVSEVIAASDPCIIWVLITAFIFLVAIVWIFKLNNASTTRTKEKRK